MKVNSKTKHLNKCRSDPGFTITPEEMYAMSKKTMCGGIEGYNCPRYYWDYRQVMWNKRRTEIKEKHISPWPPEDWKENKNTGKREPPQKTNFIDDQIKWAKSFVNEERAKTVREQLESKNRSIEMPKVPSSFHIKPGPDLKERFTKDQRDKLEAQKKIDAVPEFKSHAYEDAKAKVDQYINNKIVKVGKPNFSKCDRVTIVADAEFVGEAIPFYNTPPTDDKSGGGKKKLFYPSKECTWYKAPVWQFNSRSKMGKEKEAQSNNYLKARDDLLNEKASKALEKSGIDLKKYVENPEVSFDKVAHHGRLPFTIHKPFEFQKVQQYAESKGKQRDYSPGPNYYWDDGKTIGRPKEEKQYLMDRDKTFKRVNIPYLRRTVF
ncbi:MAG: hypothetical protein MJ252_13555 [archaeon]|nr:hypothetical protein [archaeon]